MGPRCRREAGGATACYDAPMVPAREKATTAGLVATLFWRRVRRPGWRPVGALALVLLVGPGAAGCRSAMRPDPMAPAPMAPAPMQATIASTAPAAAQGGLLQAHEYRFDGLKLGDRFGTTVLPRAPYQQPCDDDPVDKKSRRAMVYGGRPCRGSAFPEGTSVVFLLPYAKEPREEALNQPILVFAFLGGTYFHRRSNFPLRAGDPASRTALLGPVEATVDFPGYDTTLRAERHPGDVYALLDGDRVVGGLLGAMPTDPANEQWDVILQMYERYAKER